MRPLTRQAPLTLLNRSLAVATVLAALMVGAVLWFGARNSSEDAYVLPSMQVRDQLIRALKSVQSGETGQRGYLLTNRDFYLKPYTTATEQLPPMLDHLAEMVADNPQQSQKIVRLRELVKQKFDELKSTLDALNASGKDQALAIVNNDEGFRLMMEIRQTITSMQEEEDRLLAARHESARMTRHPGANRRRLVLFADLHRWLPDSPIHARIRGYDFERPGPTLGHEPGTG